MLISRKHVPSGAAQQLLPCQKPGRQHKRACQRKGQMLYNPAVQGFGHPTETVDQANHKASNKTEEMRAQVSAFATSAQHGQQADAGANRHQQFEQGPTAVLLLQAA